MPAAESNAATGIGLPAIFPNQNLGDDQGISIPFVSLLIVLAVSTALLQNRPNPMTADATCFKA
jgi:hypothetical protein